MYQGLSELSQTTIPIGNSLPYFMGIIFLNKMKSRSQINHLGIYKGFSDDFNIFLLDGDSRADVETQLGYFA